MPRLIGTRALWTLARAGHLRARIRANREAVTAIRLHLTGAAVDAGLLDALTDGGTSTAELARRMGVADEELLAAFLRVVAAAGVVTGTRRSRASTPGSTGTCRVSSAAAPRAGTSRSRAP